MCIRDRLKIVAIIDDIDRLNDEEIRAVFQLVKSLADFPNMMYFLSFDLDTVTHALNSVQAVSYTHLDVYKRQVLTRAYPIIIIKSPFIY